HAMDWTALMKEELGNAWLTPDVFRLGASTLLTDIERQLEHAATGHYAAAYKQPMG
ncbi:deoxyribose-phosphate aldolase, partial [bacterium]